MDVNNINKGIIVIIAICIIVLFIGIMKKKVEIVVNFILRATVGILGIYFVNEFFAYQNIEIAVGINPITVLTSGILGLPGFLFLYGVVIYKLLW